MATFNVTTFAGFNVALLNKEIDCDSDTFKVAFMSGEFIVDPSTQTNWSDVSGEEIVSGLAGYVDNGYELPTPQIIHDQINNKAKVLWSGECLSFTASGENLSELGGFLFYNDTHSNDVILGYAQFSGESVTVTQGSTFKLRDISFIIS